MSAVGVHVALRHVGRNSVFIPTIRAFFGIFRTFPLINIANDSLKTRISQLDFAFVYEH